jgi:hypothetical protein
MNFLTFQNNGIVYLTTNNFDHLLLINGLDNFLNLIDLFFIKDETNNNTTYWLQNNCSISHIQYENENILLAAIPTRFMNPISFSSCFQKHKLKFPIGFKENMLFINQKPIFAYGELLYQNFLLKAKTKITTIHFLHCLLL